MGRLDKLKRESMEEANKRVLGIVKEDDEIEDIINKVRDLESQADYLENDIEDFSDELEIYVDGVKKEGGSIEDDHLDFALDYVGKSIENADDAERNLYDAKYELEEYIDKQEEDDEDIPVGKSDMDKHLRGKEGGMGVLE
jgi:chromosome segregation ATPase